MLLHAQNKATIHRDRECVAVTGIAMVAELLLPRLMARSTVLGGEVLTTTTTFGR
jgi:hypothetical protein